MKLRSLNHDSADIGIGRALRLIAHMTPQIIDSPSHELLILKDEKTDEYWSFEHDRVPIHLLKMLAKMITGTIELEVLQHMPQDIYPDLHAGRVNPKSRKQAVVFLCRKWGDLGQRIPSLDERDFWGKLERALPLTQ